MKIMYIHGFDSSFKWTEKTKILSELGEVFGVSYPTDENPDDNIELLSTYMINNKIDLLVGTSLGGWYASKIGGAYGVPFVCINPSTDPSKSLLKYIGEPLRYNGSDNKLTLQVCDAYTPINGEGCGMILLDKGDNIIPYTSIYEIDNGYEIVEFDGGSHRFEHMQESLPFIQKFFNQAQISYGSTPTDNG